MLTFPLNDSMLEYSNHSEYHTLEPTIFNTFFEQSCTGTKYTPEINQSKQCLGLKEVSSQVYKALLTRKKFTLDQILQQINLNLSIKNKKRRIYDCLNVMIANKLVSKTKGQYQYIEQNNQQNLDFSNIIEEIEKINEIKSIKQSVLASKKKTFNKLTKQFKKMQELIQRNQKLNLDFQEQIFYQPLMLVKSKIEEQIILNYSEQEVRIDSKNPINIIKFDDIVIELEFNE